MKRLIPAILLLACAGTAFAQFPTPDEIMKENDTNKDGVVTKEEASKTPLAGFFDNLDKNHDGQLTLEEIKAIGGG